MAITHPLTLKFMFCAQFCVHLFFHLYKIVMHPTSVQPTFYSQPQLFKEPFFKGLLNTDKYFPTRSQHPFWWSWLDSNMVVETLIFLFLCIVLFCLFEINLYAKGNCNSRQKSKELAFNCGNYYTWWRTM